MSQIFDIVEELEFERKKNKELENQNQSYQECINYLEDRTHYYEDKTFELQDRIDKAIEYINNNSLYEEEYDYDYEENIYLSGINDTQVRNDLLNILKGE